MFLKIMKSSENRSMSPMHLRHLKCFREIYIRYIHQVYTGVTVLIKKNGKWEDISFSESTDVSFYPVSDEGDGRILE